VHAKCWNTGPLISHNNVFCVVLTITGTPGTHFNIHNHSVFAVWKQCVFFWGRNWPYYLSVDQIQASRLSHHWAVSRWPSIAASWIRWRCSSFDGRSWIETGVFLIRVLSFPPSTSNLPLLHTRIHLRVTLTGRTNRRSLKTFKGNAVLYIVSALDRIVLSVRRL